MQNDPNLCHKIFKFAITVISVLYILTECKFKIVYCLSKQGGKKIKGKSLNFFLQSDLSFNHQTIQ